MCDNYPDVHLNKHMFGVLLVTVTSCRVSFLPYAQILIKAENNVSLASKCIKMIESEGLVCLATKDWIVCGQ